MCGRLVQSFSGLELEELLGPLEGSVALARYNVAPSQPLAIVRAQGDRRSLGLVRWGLIPAGAADPGAAAPLINARAETLDEKPAFRGALKSRRCIVPSSGFYEWQRHGRQTQPYYCHSIDGRPLAFAGLWEVWHDPRGRPVETATVVTVAANGVVAPLHDRMPAILRGDAIAAWLDPRATDLAKLKSLLEPVSDQAMVAYAVGLGVNHPKNDGPECVQPQLGGPSQLKLF
jgi:putative SOS response-associated peptidase YedK